MATVMTCQEVSDLGCGKTFRPAIDSTATGEIRKPFFADPGTDVLRTF
jgi:hypothetical protein